MRLGKEFAINQISLLVECKSCYVETLCNYPPVSFLLCTYLIRIAQKNSLFVFESQAWKELNLPKLQLTKVYRQKDPVLLKALEEIRYCKLSQETIQLMMSLSRTPKHGQISTCLFALRSEAARLNQRELSKLPGETKIYKSEDHVPGGATRERIVKQLNDSMLVPEILELRVGAQIMILKNNQAKNLYNGTVGTVTELQSDCIVVQIHYNKSIVVITRETCTIETHSYSSAPARTQFPVVLAYAM